MTAQWSTFSFLETHPCRTFLPLFQGQTVSSLQMVSPSSLLLFRYSLPYPLLNLPSSGSTVTNSDCKSSLQWKWKLRNILSTLTNTTSKFSSCITTKSQKDRHYKLSSESGQNQPGLWALKWTVMLGVCTLSWFVLHMLLTVIEIMYNYNCVPGGGGWPKSTVRLSNNITYSPHSACIFVY